MNFDLLRSRAGLGLGRVGGVCLVIFGLAGSSPGGALAHDAKSTPASPRPAAKVGGMTVATTSRSLRTPEVAKLPPLPAGVTELKFGEFFVRPVGPRGLELTDKLLGLDGQRV